MRALALVPSGLMILVGAVFTGQGFGYIPGSFMTGSVFWGITGLLLVVCGLGLLVFAARSGSPD